MTFSSFDQYKVKILFDDWNVTEKWQFVLSWFAIVIACIIYHWMKYITRRLNYNMDQQELRLGRQLLTTPITGVARNSTGLSIDSTLAPVNEEQANRELLILHVVRAFWNSLQYGWALLLMLVAMTYNSSLFVALIVGYFFGELIFQSMPVCDSRSLNRDEVTCH